LQATSQLRQTIPIVDIVAEFRIWKSEEDRRLNAECICCASSLICAYSRKFRTSRNRRVRSTLRPVSGDDCVDLGTLASVSRKDGCGNHNVVVMSPHRY